MEATVLDDRRRLVLPAAFKPKSAVTVQMIDDETILVKLAKPSGVRMVMLLPDVKEFAANPEWEKTERAFAGDSNKGLAKFEE